MVWMPGANLPTTPIASAPPWEWTEAVTLIKIGHVPDAVYEAVSPYFNEKESVGPDICRGCYQCLEQVEHCFPELVGEAIESVR